MPFYYGDSYGGVANSAAQAGQFQANLVQNAIAAKAKADQEAAQQEQQKWQDYLALQAQLSNQQQQGNQFDLSALLAANNQRFAQNQDTRAQAELGLRTDQENRLGKQLNWQMTRPDEHKIASDDRDNALLFNQALNSVRAGTDLPADLSSFTPAQRQILQSENDLTKRLKSDAATQTAQDVSLVNRAAQLQADRKKVTPWYNPSGISQSTLEKNAGLTEDQMNALISAAGTVQGKDFASRAVFDPTTGRYVSRTAQSVPPPPPAPTAPVTQFVPQIPQVATQVSAPIAGERRVPIVLPSGQQVTIPYSQLGSALKLGAKVAQLP